jgi:uncharacterized delta-60 repeat protein
MATRAVHASRNALRFVLLACIAALGAGTVSAAPGELDNTFGYAGRVSSQFIDSSGESIDPRVYAIAQQQSDGKLVVAGSSTRFNIPGDSSRHILVARLNTDGTLDTTFDGDGWTSIDFAGGQSQEEAYALLIQPDGKIVVAGQTTSWESGLVDIALVRLESNGSLDPDFGTNGRVALDTGGTTIDRANGIVRRASDGRLVVAGNSDYNGVLDIVFAAVTATGQPDNAFGTQGITHVTFGPGAYQGVNALVQQSDGALMAAGYGPGSNLITTMALVRVTPAGVLDTTFDEDGLKIVDFGQLYGEATSLVMQSDDKIVVAGYADAAGGRLTALARLETNGDLDPSFGGTGTVMHDLGPDWNLEQAAGVIVQPGDGKIVIAGNFLPVDASRAQDLFVARFESNGDVDTTFGNQGVAIADFGGRTQSWAHVSSATATALLRQSDGRLVAIGQENSGAAIAARFESTGGGSGGVLSFEETSRNVNENQGTVTFAVRRTGGATGAVSAKVRVGGSNGYTLAGTGCDFTLGTVTLNWASGDYADKLVSVTIIDDSYQEIYDNFELELYGAVGATLALDVLDVGINWDAGDTVVPNVGTISIEPTKTVGESAGSVTLTVSRTGGSQDCAVVGFTTDNGTGYMAATAGVDYAATSGLVQFGDGDSTTKTITVPIIDDAVGEADEEFWVKLQSFDPALLGNTVGTVTILDNDGGFPGRINVYGDGQDNESDGASGGPITFVRDQGSNGQVSVEYTITSGTATAGSDFIATSGTITWAAGDTSNKQIYVQIIDDLLQEGNETYLVTISNPTGGAVLGDSTQWTQTILDNDTKYPGEISCLNQTNMVFENSGKAWVYGLRQNGRDGEVTVDYTTTSGTATAGADFTTTSGTLHWADQSGCTPAPGSVCSGDPQQFIEIPIIDDSDPENDENFAVTFSNPTGGATLASNATCTVTIYRNDSLSGTISVTTPNPQVGEAAGTVTISVARTGGTQGAVTVDFRTIPNTATGNVDFTSTSGTLAWADGESGTKTITVPILDDALVDPNENFYVLLENITPGAILDYTYWFAVVTIIDDENNPGTIAVPATPINVVEGAGSVNVNVSRIYGVSGAASVNYTTVAGTAQPPGDYTTTSGTLNWAAGVGGVRTITIPITNDTVTESPESFTVHFSNQTAGVLLPNADATVNIADDDDPGDISMSLSTVSVSENAVTLGITATRSTGSSGAVSVNYATANGTATAGSDYTAASGTFTWANGELGPKTVQITILDDAIEEPDETFAVNLSGPTGGARLQQASTTVTILDNDANPGQLRFAVSTRSVSEGAATVQVDVERFGGSLGAVSVHYATADGAALAGSDYTTTAGTLNWADGDKTTHSFSIPIVNDTIYETDESFTVILSNPGGGAVLGTPSVETVTITNDDAPNGDLGLTVNSLTVTEGEQAVLQVARTNGSGGPVQIDYATSNGSATAPEDYTAASGTLTWAAGDSSPKTITVNTVDDALDEPTETFSVTLTNPTGGAYVGMTQATVSITDNDIGPPGTLAMTAAAVSTNESSGTLHLAVQRTGGFSGVATVNYATQDFTALAGSDYTAASGTLTWADGDTAPKVIAIAITNDTLDEPDETFNVVLSGATGATLDPTATTTVVTILDDDLPPAPGVLSVAGPLSVDESATSVTFTFTRAAGIDGAVSVDYATVAGTATANVDYTSRSGTLTWANGDSTSKNVAVPIIDDAIDEPNETFAMTLSNPTGGATLGTASASMLIVDNDVSGPGILGIVQNVSVLETVGDAIVSVQRTNGFTGAVSVNYSTSSDTAVAGQDFTTTSGTLNWADGEGGVKFISIPILNDSVSELTESFVVTLAAAGGGATIGANPGYVSIQDDDNPGTLAFTQTAQLVSETAGSVTFYVSRTSGSKGAVSVNYATAAGSATAGSDFTDTAGILNWADGDVSNKAVTVPILDDALVEPDEIFTIALSGATGGAAVGTAATATVTIQSDEVPVPGTIRMVSGAVTVGEPAGTVSVSVERVGGSDGVVTIDYATVAGTATAADYTPASGTLTWADGDAAIKTINVAITDDTAYEPDETFAVTLSNPGGGAILANPSTTVTIQSDDAAVPGTLGFAAINVSVNEPDGTVVLSVTRTGGSDGAVSVHYATAYATATAADFTATSGTLNWANGDSAAKTITVAITNDTLFEPDEAFTVLLSGVTGGASLGAAAATVTIVSEDPPQRGTLAMANAALAVDETAGTVTITVNRSGGSDGAVGVSYATAAGSATAGSDYTDTSGTLSWADGDAAPKTFTVPILDDLLFESDETFTATLSGATGGAALGTATTTVTIQSNEAPVAGTLRMATTAVTVNETDGTVNLTVERIGGSDNPVGVSYATATGTAGAGDFTATSGTLTWANGDAASKTITVPITNDTAYEPDETFTVTLSNATGGAALGTPVTTVTIVSEDLPQRGTLAMAAATATVQENLGPVTIFVNRTGGADGAVSIDYATATGTAGAADFTARSGTLTWADGDSAAKSIAVSITNDTAYEPDETFTVTLSNATGGATLGAATTTVTIVSEDAPQRGTIAMTSTTATVNEAAGTVTISVSRSGGTDGAVGISYATTAGTASAADFTATSGTLSWADGESGTRNFTVAITNDVLVENDEAFAVTLSNPTGGAALGAASTTVTIQDDDILIVPGVLGLTQSAVTVSETAPTVTLTVTRTNGLGGAVSVHYETASGSATSGADFSPASGTLTWAHGEGGAKTIIVGIINDTSVEPDETFTVTLSDAQGGAALGTSSATITIQSEDIPPDTTPDGFSFTDQTGLPPNAEVQSNEITVAGINAPAPISVVGGEYSINGGAFTATAGTVANGERVRVRVTASGSYSTTVSATLTIGGVSDTFSVTTKPATVATVVHGRSGGGSFGWLGALMLGALGMARRRRPGTVALGIVLSSVALAPVARADETGIYFGGGGGVSQVNVSAGEIQRWLESATGASVTSVKVDNQGVSYQFRVGYMFNRIFALEAAYYDFGIFETEVAADVLDPIDFAGTLANAIPSNMHGPAMVGRFSWPFAERWAVHVRAGWMAWRSNASVEIVSGGSGKYQWYVDGSDLVWGAALAWRATDHFDVAVEFTQVELRDPVQSLQLNVDWRPGWLSR